MISWQIWGFLARVFRCPFILEICDGCIQRPFVTLCACNFDLTYKNLTFDVHFMSVDLL